MKVIRPFTSVMVFIIEKYFKPERRPEFLIRNGRSGVDTKTDGYKY